MLKTLIPTAMLLLLTGMASAATAPVASNMTVSKVQGQPIEILLSVSSTDYEIPFLECIRVTEPTHGTLVYTITNFYPLYSYMLKYTPSAGYIGTDSFIFKARDYRGLESGVATCSITVTANIPPVASNQKMIVYGGETSATIALPFTDPDAQPRTFTALTNPTKGTFGTFDTATGQFTYIPNAGASGTDSFTWKLNDGFGDSNVATCTLILRDPANRAGDVVLVIVNENLRPQIATEIDRLRDDLNAEGYSARVVSWPAASSVKDLWTRLSTEYYRDDQFLSGAILVGSLPKPFTQAYTDMPYWRLDQLATENPNEGGWTYPPYHIWVSRINADDTTWGSEATLVRRALDANHSYRTGRSRLPHGAYVFDAMGYANQQANAMFDIWPEVFAGGGGDHNATYKFLPSRADINNAACDAFVAGGEIFDESSHGDANGYMEGSWFDKTALYRLIAQQRFALCTSCTSGAFGGIVNNQLFTRGGGLVYTVGGTSLQLAGDFPLVYGGTQVQFRSLLARGESWGRAMVCAYPFKLGPSNRTIHYGDLSIAALGHNGGPYPANAMPQVQPLTVSTTTPVSGQPVTFTVSFTDADTNATDNPEVSWKHQIEWFLTGYDSGRSTPTRVTDSTQSGYTSVTYAFASVGSYTARVEVIDEWGARTWREIGITVNTPPNAVNDTATTEADKVVAIAVLANDSDPDGQPISLVSVTDPPHGSAAISATTVVYTPDPGYTGGDSFTYTIRDTMGATATATVNVTVTTDITPPRIQEAFSTPGTVTVVFDEPVTAGSGAGGAENPTNYTLDRDIGITSASLSGDLRTVTMNVNPAMAFGTTYTLTVNCVTDRATIPNPIAPNTRVSFICADYTPGVAYWAMNEPLWTGVAGEVRDRCAGACHGQAQGNAITGAGRVGRAGLFTGGRVSIPDAPRLRLGSAHSIACWVRIDVANTDWLRLVGKGESNARNFGLWRSTGGDVLYQIQTTTGQKDVQTTGGGRLVVGSGWHHLAGTCDGSVMVLYLDGQEVARGNLSGTPLTSAAPVTLGYADFHQQSFTGGLDEVRLFDRALSAKEVEANFTVIPTPTAPTAMTATAVATNRIDLGWMDNAVNETGYLIERSPDSNAWALVTVTTANATNHSDGGLAADTLYYYRLAATNENGTSALAYASARTLTVYGQWRRERFTPGELGDPGISGDNADPDHDGMSNINEFLSGTDPKAAGSVLAIAGAELAAGTNGFVLVWQSASNRFYDIHRFTNLVNVVTNVIATDLPATPPLNVYTDQNADAQMLFYRIRVK